MRRICVLFAAVVMTIPLIASAYAKAPEDTVGTLSVQVKRLQQEQPGSGACELGELLALSVRMQQNVDLAVVPSGALENDLPVGNITWSDVTNAVDEAQRIAVATVTPAQLYDLLEGALSHLIIDREQETLMVEESYFDGFPQVSGIYLKVDGSAMAGEHIYAMQMEDGTVLSRDDQTTSLTLASTEGLLSGRYGYATDAEYQLTEDTLATALADYLGKSERPSISGNSIQIIGTADETLVNKISKGALLAILAAVSASLVILSSRYHTAKNGFLPMQEGETRRC